MFLSIIKNISNRLTRGVTLVKKALQEEMTKVISIFNDIAQEYEKPKTIFLPENQTKELLDKLDSLEPSHPSILRSLKRTAFLFGHFYADSNFNFHHFFEPLMQNQLHFETSKSLHINQLNWSIQLMVFLVLLKREYTQKENARKPNFEVEMLYGPSFFTETGHAGSAHRKEVVQFFHFFQQEQMLEQAYVKLKEFDFAVLQDPKKLMPKIIYGLLAKAFLGFQNLPDEFFNLILQLSELIKSSGAHPNLRLLEINSKFCRLQADWKALIQHLLLSLAPQIEADLRDYRAQGKVDYFLLQKMAKHFEHSPNFPTRAQIEAYLTTPEVQGISIILFAGENLVAVLEHAYSNSKNDADLRQHLASMQYFSGLDFNKKVTSDEKLKKVFEATLPSSKGVDRYVPIALTQQGNTISADTKIIITLGYRVFSLGQRRCPGEAIARQLGTFILAYALSPHRRTISSERKPEQSDHKSAFPNNIKNLLTTLARRSDPAASPNKIPTSRR